MNQYMFVLEILGIFVLEMLGRNPLTMYRVLLAAISPFASFSFLCFFTLYVLFFPLTSVVSCLFSSLSLVLLGT